MACSIKPASGRLDESHKAHRQWSLSSSQDVSKVKTLGYTFCLFVTNARSQGTHMLKSTRGGLALVGLGLLALMGCGSGGGASGGPPRYPVSGLVTFNGQPLAGADIVFKMKDGSLSSFGRTDDKGHYELTTRSSNDGAPEGDYLVSISKTDTAAQDASKMPLQDDKNYNPYIGKNAPPTVPKPVVPSKFGDTATSGLTARVGKEKNELNFNLK
jgi:hypothetical protein